MGKIEPDPYQENPGRDTEFETTSKVPMTCNRIKSLRGLLLCQLLQQSRDISSCDRSIELQGVEELE